MQIFTFGFGIHKKYASPKPNEIASCGRHTNFYVLLACCTCTFINYLRRKKKGCYYYYPIVVSFLECTNQSPLGLPSVLDFGNNGFARI